MGFITAVSDGVSCDYIPHLEVLSAYQGQGIGTELIRQMLAKLRHLYMIDLVCDPALRPFYARLGMHTVVGMVMRNYVRSTSMRLAVSRVECTSFHTIQSSHANQN
jgi:GNAT superfamily N-acetyltransferase